MQARNAPSRWKFWTGVDLWYLLIKVTVSDWNYKALNIYVITALNASSEAIEVNRKFHVVAGLGSDVISWIKWIIRLILAIQASHGDDVRRKEEFKSDKIMHQKENIHWKIITRELWVNKKANSEAKTIFEGHTFDHEV